MTRALRKAGRSLLTVVLALIPCALLILSLAKMSPAPPQAPPAQTTFAVTLQEPVVVMPSPGASETAALSTPRPALPVPDLPTPPDLPTHVGEPSKPVPIEEPLPALKLDALPSQVRISPVPPPLPPAVTSKPEVPAQRTQPQPENKQPPPPEPVTAQRSPGPTENRVPLATAHRSTPRLDGYEWGEIDHPPTIVRRIPPKYPYKARRRGITGTVVVRFLITEDGTVTSAEIMKADPLGVFENAALSCVRKWKFRPGRHQGKPVSTWAELPFRFKL